MMYVLQIRTGEEEAVLEQLRRQGIAGLLPQELRLTRRRGCWTEEKHKLLPGYLFVDVQYTDSLYYAIVALPAVLRVLKADGRPAPLPEPEEQYIRFLGEKLLSPSVVRRLPDGRGQPLSGVLTQLSDGNIRYDWHARRATVTISLFGSIKTLHLSFRIPEEPAG